MNKNREEFLADMLLLLVTMFWGFSYIAIHIAIPETGTLGLNAYRFITAGIITAAIFHKRLEHIDRETFKWGFLVGASLCATYGFTNMSIRYTSTPNAAFLCAMGVVFVPIIELLFMHKKQSLRLAVSVILSVIGVALLTLTGGGTLPETHLFGDACGIITAIIYAFEMIATGIAVKEKHLDAVVIGILSMFWTGFGMLMISAAAGDLGVPTTRNAIIAVLFLTFLCSAFSFIAQPVAQRHTEASHVGIIMALEPVFALMIAFAVEGTLPTHMQMLGQALMIVALIVLEVDFSQFTKKRS